MSVSSSCIMSDKDLQDALANEFFETDKGKKYIDELESSNSRLLVLNLDDVYDYSQAVFSGLLNCENILGVISEAATYSLVVRGGNRDPPVEITIIGTKIPTMFIHQISSKWVHKIIKVHGMVTRASPHIRPIYSKIVFVCSNCGAATVQIEQFNPFFLLKPIGKCQSCKTSPSWIPDDSMSIFLDSQEFNTQESQNDIPSSRIPSGIKCLTFEPRFMNYANCGDDVDLIGVVKLLRRDKSNFTTPYLKVLSIEKRRKELSEIQLSLSDEAEVIALSKRPDVYELLTQSFAPSICGNNEEKEAILHCIFGSPEERKKDITIRGTIHMLMVGDPSTAKSQLLRAAMKLSPKGMYAMGRGTSGAGLTAALHQNEDSKEWEISAGVLVLCDEGIACIDEIDKMREEDRVNIHEAMEQGTVSINKAGVHATLRAKASIISAANPPLGKFDRTKSVFDNLGDFPPSLFSRFDLIFTLFDEPNEETDRQVVTHIMDGCDETCLIPDDLYRKYIIYAKKINPTLSEEAKDYLKTYFVKIRNDTKLSQQRDVPFTYRQFEALKRLTLAHARMLLKSQADMDDVGAIQRLFDKFLEDIGHDITGQECGKGKDKRENLINAEDIILRLLGTNGIMTLETIRDEIVNKRQIPDKIFFEVWNRLIGNGNKIMEYSPNNFSLHSYRGQKTLG